MTVIPFDPGRPRPARRRAPHDRPAARAADVDALYAARLQVETLELLVIETLRESAINWARAERAEAALALRRARGAD